MPPRNSELVDEIALSVPARLHRVVFRSEGLFGVRAFCEGCGWTQVAEPRDSDALYWRSRAHLTEVAERQRDNPPE